jgi:hypothetical protein
MLLVAPPDADFSDPSASEAFLVAVTKMDRYLGGDTPDAWVRSHAARMAAETYAYGLKTAYDATLVDKQSVRVDGRKAIRLVLAATIGEREVAFIPYFVGTRDNVYMLCFTAPGKSIEASAKYRELCDELIDGFTLTKSGD